MAVEKAKALRATCDGCGKETLHPDEGEPILGYTGVVQFNSTIGGTRAEWYACNPDCVGNAIEAALTKSKQ
jgi:hypothetical protein